jgi:hypothetical protein
MVLLLTHWMVGRQFVEVNPRVLFDKQHDPRVATEGRHSVNRRRTGLISLDLNLRLVIQVPLRWIAALLIFLTREGK